MAKSLLRLKARELRRQNGKSIRDISSILEIAKSTVSLWCRDIELNKKQVENLLIDKIENIRRGQLNGALVQKNKRLKKVSFYEQQGIKKLNKLSDKEFFMAGLALYLGEGAKKSRRVELVNSDPKIIKFMIQWFVYNFGVDRSNFTLSVLINQIHRKREVVVRKFWSSYLDFPLSQFRQTIFVKSKQNKIYENYDNYYGTLRLSILKSSDLLYKILGLIKGLLQYV